MNQEERSILRRKHRLIVSNLDTKVIRQSLYEKGIVDDPLYLEDDEVPTRRAEKFMKIIIEKCSLQTLIQVFLEHEYSFIANPLQEEYNKLCGNKDTVEHQIPRDRKEPIFEISWRVKTIHFRHALKRLGHSGDIQRFNMEKSKIEKQWMSVSVPFDFTDENREIADMYFMAKDAELERLRMTNDNNFSKSETICKEIMAISAYTSSNTIPVAMQLARLGSASLVAGKATIQQAMKYIEVAKQRLSTIPACRETGVVLYIEYNMLAQLYETDPLSTTREKLLQLGENVIIHFESETTDETMGSDFRRMVLLKLSHILLNIGLYHNFLDEKITEDDMKKAENILKEIEKPEHWCRMEDRWLMFYYTAKSRLCKLRNINSIALDFMHKSKECAKKCKCIKELNNIRAEIKSITKVGYKYDAFVNCASSYFHSGLKLWLYIIPVLICVIMLFVFVLSLTSVF